MTDRQRTIEGILDLALRMADIADEITMSGFFSYFDVSTKPDGSPVTSVDRRVEVVLRRMVDSEHPSAGFLGEEYPATVGFGRWIVDPIDGTEAFMEGDSRFASLIAFEVDDTPIAGVVTAPALGLRWWAAKGKGARVSRDGDVSAARVSVVADPAHAHALLPKGRMGSAHADDRLPIGRVARSGARLETYDSSWQAVRVAGNDVDVAVAEGKWWDVAPLPIIVGEAGGMSSRYRTPQHDVGVVVTNRLLAPAFTGAPVGR